LPLLAVNRTETWLWWLEIALFVVPTILLFQSRVRIRPGALYACAVMIVFGFIANRLNVAITGMEAASGTHYIPKWSEIAVTLSIVAVGFAIFRVIGEHFPIFEAQPRAHVHAASENRQEERVPVG
jgi:Ni/Fe-hydrogenase subunit HybB-like protein